MRRWRSLSVRGLMSDSSIVLLIGRKSFASLVRTTLQTTLHRPKDIDFYKHFKQSQYGFNQMWKNLHKLTAKLITYQEMFTSFN